MLYTNTDNQEIGHIINTKIKESQKIKIISAFITMSGAKFILNNLVNENIEKVQIITGTYLDFTDPSALALLKSNSKVEIRLSKEKNFHPKTYIFEKDNENSIFIGSSNLTNNALFKNVEWNYHFKDLKNTSEIYIDFINNYNELWKSSEYMSNHVLEHYLNTRKISNHNLDIIKQEKEIEKEQNKENEIQPRDVQVIALQKVKEYINEQNNIGLIQIATGLGKTYLSAFLAKEYKKTLFIVHRNEIIKQVANSYKSVMPNKSIAIFNGEQKEVVNGDKNIEEADILIVNVKTFIKHYKKWKSDYFDLVVVDEAHHSVTNSYKDLIEYFKPKFTLGLTATIERMDGLNVLKTFKNIIFKCNFISAINNGWLSPINYIGVKDVIDYSKIDYKNKKYDENQLLTHYYNPSYQKNVLDKYNLNKNFHPLTIAFCSNINHAKVLNDYFNTNNIKSEIITSMDNSNETNNKIARFKNKEFEIIFTVDKFNEGFDLPDINTVLLLRPTQSPTVYLQQIGRGLRKQEDKKLYIIDFISNYKNVEFRFDHFTKIAKPKDFVPSVVEKDMPAFSNFKIETEAVNIIRSISKKLSQEDKEIYYKERYNSLKESLGERPTFKQFQEIENISISDIRNVNKYKNPLNFIEEVEQTTFSDDFKEYYLKFVNAKFNKFYKIMIWKYIFIDHCVDIHSYKDFSKSYYEFNRIDNDFDFNQPIYSYSFYSQPLLHNKDQIFNVLNDKFVINFHNDFTDLESEMIKEIVLYREFTYFNI